MLRSDLPVNSSFNVSDGKELMRELVKKRGALTFLLSYQLLQLLGAVDHSACLRVFGLPLAQVLKKAVYIVARLSGQLVFDPPGFLENRIGFHRFNLLQAQSECKSPGEPARVQP